MKKIIIYILFAISVIGTNTSCEKMFGDFLEKAPGVDVSIDTVFSSKAQAQMFLTSCYEQALFNPWNEAEYYYGTGTRSADVRENLSFFSTISDEGFHEAPSWWNGNDIRTGNVSLSRITNIDPFAPNRFTALRMVNTMLEKIDIVPDADEAYKTQIKAEMHHLRAELHFANFMRYGGISLVKKTFKASEISEMKVRRSSVDSTVQFILQDLDFAISNLPDEYPSNMRGRITKGASLALKSRTLLYAASPLFNTDNPPLSMKNPEDNRLICYGNYDINRWQAAADAAKAVLDWAPLGGIHLITDQGVDKNYRYVWEINDNAEVILANKHADGNWRTVASNDRPYKYWLCAAVGGLQGCEPNHCFIEKFYDKIDGTPQDWPDQANNLNEKYAELDYRFRQTIGYNGFYWNKQRGILAMYLGPGTPGQHSNKLYTSYFAKKWVPDVVNSQTTKADIDFFRYRLAEFYLNYAESLNEAQGPVSEAYAAVNTIRERSGMPPLPAGLTREEFRQRIRKERGAELAFEAHRWWDIRRWRIGEEAINGPEYGLKIYKNLPETKPLTFRYEKTLLINRLWKPQLYYYPFSVDQVNLGYIIQNPGW